MSRRPKQRPQCVGAALALVSVALACSEVQLPTADPGGTTVALAVSEEAPGGGGPGASGIDRSKYLDELTPQELQRFCQWSTPAQGGAGKRDCDGVTLHTPSVQACSEDDAEVHCSVAVAEACVSSTGGDACKVFETQPCAAFLRCALENGVTVERRIPPAGAPDAADQGSAATKGP